MGNAIWFDEVSEDWENNVKELDSKAKDLQEERDALILVQELIEGMMDRNTRELNEVNEILVSYINDDIKNGKELSKLV